MESLDFVHMEPDLSAVAIPPHAGRCYALVKPGESVAVYIHSRRKEPRAGALLDLAKGRWQTAWLHPATGEWEPARASSTRVAGWRSTVRVSTGISRCISAALSRHEISSASFCTLNPRRMRGYGAGATAKGPQSVLEIRRDGNSAGRPQERNSHEIWTEKGLKFSARFSSPAYFRLSSSGFASPYNILFSGSSQ